MANVEVRLKVSKSAYEEKINRLNNYLNRLDATITSYEKAKNDLDSFMDGSDDNYNKMRESVETNIKTVRKAREMTVASIDMLKQTLSQMEDFGSNLGNMITSGTEAAVSGIQAAVEAMNLVD